MQILLDIDMEQQGLAAARCAPERNLVQIIGGVIAKLLCAFFGAVSGHFSVQAVQQILPPVEKPVEIDFAEQQAEILKILHPIDLKSLD